MVVEGRSSPFVGVDTYAFDQHADRMAGTGHVSPAAVLPWFDVRQFGHELRRYRQSLGLSTRSLAEAAGISQAYLVALEGSTSSRGPAGPCPTVQVLVALASALRLDAATLMTSSLRQVGRHVMHVVDDETRAFEHARADGGDVDVWISAGLWQDPTSDTPHIAMHPDGDTSYDASGIEATLRAGLQRFGDVLRERRVGLVFSDLEENLIKQCGPLRAVERDWQRLVSAAAWSTGARSATSICLYQKGALQRVDAAVDTAIDLITTHETLRVTHEGQTSTGRRACAELLDSLRPSGVGATRWRRSWTERLHAATSAGSVAGA